MEATERSPLTAVRRALVAGWLAAAAVTILTVPPYKGTIDTVSRWFWIALATPPALAAVLANPATASSWRGALATSALPLVLLAAAGGSAYVRNDDASEFRGEPLFLYVGIALLVSWGLLAVATAVLTRTRWTSPGTLAATLLVSAVAFAAMTLRID